LSDKWILDAARDFRTGSMMLGNPLQQQKFPLRSAVVTLVFSIELYLKYFSKKDLGQFEKNHDLSKLYELLPQSVRDNINGHYKHSLPISDVLNKYKDAFIEWRYIFEKQLGTFMVDIQSLQLVNDALEATAADLK
jgi:hypothetical protein